LINGDGSSNNFQTTLAHVFDMDKEYKQPSIENEALAVVPSHNDKDRVVLLTRNDHQRERDPYNGHLHFLGGNDKEEKEYWCEITNW
jgi:hypothetical protein